MSIRVNDQEGTVQLSKKKLDGLKVWDDMELPGWRTKTTVEGVITEENKGGRGCQCEGHPGLYPRFPDRHRQGRLTCAGMVGKTRADGRITEVNRARRRVVGSIRAVSCRGP